MPIKWLTDPITDDAPCGPDLERANDDDFLDYYFDADGRLPTRYFTPGTRSDSNKEGAPDVLFDPKSVDLPAERAEIEALLKNSRDLRLLSLLARWGILAGNTSAFADAIDGAAELLSLYPEDVHPTLEEGAAKRRDPLEELADRITVLAPLQHLHLNGQSDVTYRRYLVATGKSEARFDEQGVSANKILSALQDSSSKMFLDKTHKDLSTAATGLARIRAICEAHPAAKITLKYDEVLTTLSEILALIHQARPDLPAWSADEAESTAEADLENTDGTSDSDEGAPTLAPASVADAEAADAISGQAAARVTLQTIETYLAAHEPSSAALLLITQARLLIGRPLIEALETLLPAQAAKAVIDFGPQHGFVLTMDRLKTLAGETRGEPPVEQNPADPPVISTRADVASYLRSVENYYRKYEPTSPIPVLLVRARNYLDKDFEAIVAELLPTPKQDAE